MADIILAEDDDRVRSVLTLALTRDGHDVREAANGRAALAALHARAPDLLVTDVYMPEMDGIELLTRIRQTHASLRVVLMSGGGNMPQGDVLDIAGSLGATLTLPKPVSPAQLRDAVRTALSRSPRG